MGRKILIVFNKVEHLEASFRNMAGVKEAKVDYDAKRAIISYDPARQNEQALRKLITDAGYSMRSRGDTCP